MMAEIHDSFDDPELDREPVDEAESPRAAALAGWLIVLALLMTLVAAG